MSIDDEDIKKAWVRRVKELMPQKGFNTYQDLAYKSGVSAGSLNQAMRGMHLPRQTTIEKIATALDTTPQYLLYGDSMRVVREIPVMLRPDSLYRWIKGESESKGEVRRVVVSGSSDFSEKAFAWPVAHNHMEPMFLEDDIVIFEPLKGWSDIRDKYALVIKPIFEHDDIVGYQDHWVFGRLEKNNQGVMITSSKDYCEPVFLDERYAVIGIAVQQIRNFRIK